MVSVDVKTPCFLRCGDQWKAGLVQRRLAVKCGGGRGGRIGREQHTQGDENMLSDMSGWPSQVRGRQTTFACLGDSLADDARSLWELQRSPVHHLSYRTILIRKRLGWGCSSVGRASDRWAADAGSIPRCGKGFFSQSQLSMQTLLRCPYTQSVQSNVLTSVLTLKTP